jgi:hypothetical protein
MSNLLEHHSTSANITKRKVSLANPTIFHPSDKVGLGSGQV